MKKLHPPTQQSSLWYMRLSALLQKGLKDPFIFVVAGSGYGKSDLLHAFSAQEGYLPIALSLTPMDNYTEHFWRKLVRALSAVDSTFPSHPAFRSYPATLQALDNAMQAIKKALPKNKHTLLIFDNFQHITNEVIRTNLFFDLDIETPGFSVVILTSSADDAAIRPTCMHTSPVRITSQDLLFTGEEVAYYFEQNEIPRGTYHLAQIMQLTGGWPFAVEVLCKQIADGLPPNKNWTLDTSGFFDVLQAEYFTNYPADTQNLLTRLAILPLFTLEIATEVGNVPLQQVTATLRDNPFIIADAAHTAYTMQAAYATFISTTYPLSELEQKETLLLAGGYYLSNGLLFEALEAFMHAGAYGDVFDAMRNYPLEQINLQIANQFFSFLYAMPDEYIDNHPYVRIYRAIMAQYAGKADQSEAMLTALLKVFKQQPIYLGEIYLALGVLIIHHRPMQAVKYIRMATELLPDGSFFRKEDSLGAANRSLIRLQSNPVLTLSAMVPIIDEITNHFSILFRRSHKSLAHLYRAEFSFCLLDLPATRTSAYEALYHASLNKHHGIQCNALFVLMRTAVMSGELEQAEDALHQIESIINENQLSSLYTLRDSALGWFHIKIHNFANVPSWLKNVNVEDMTSLQLVSERDIILRVAYFLESNDTGRALALANAYLPYCINQGFWIVRINLLVSLALLHSKQDDMPTAIRYLQEAYELSYPHGVILPFVEAGYHMRTLLSKVEYSPDLPFDEQWFNAIRTRSSTYAKRISTLSNQYFGRQEDAGSKTYTPLTKRETEVLQYLSQGLKYAEIANFMSVSVNGVKKHVMSIYNKLDANNRGDAIRHALQTGLIV